MIEHIILGILIAAASVGAYVSARTMSRGPVFYRGRAFLKEIRATQCSPLPVVEADHVLQVEEWPDVVDEAIRTVELHMVEQLALAKSRGVSLSDVDFESKRLLFKLKRAKYLRMAPKGMAPKKFWGEGSEIEQPKSDRRWKDNIEQRLRALEEKAAAEDQAALAGEEGSVPAPEQIH
jgi:hypothetical protein